MSLNQLLSQPDVSVPELFQHPDILNQIKYRIQIFVDFCKRNQDFTKIMISMGIKTPMHKNENVEMRKVAHVASDILTCDNDALAQLFVIEEIPSRIRCYSESQDQVIEQILSNEVTGQLIIADRTPSKQNKQQDQFTKKYVFLIDLLSYVQEKQPDQNCINYMVKVLNTVIRVKAEQLYQFFKQRPELLKRMIELTNYPSVSYSIVKFINEGQDKKYRDFKTQIINMIIKEIIGKINENNFSVYVQFIEEVFDKNRHRNEEQDQIKIVTQPLVNKQVINFMIQGALSNKSQNQTSNCLLYLLKVSQRMNLDQQQDPYSYNEPQNNKPTMDFQIDQIYSNFDKLINLAPSISRQRYSSLQVLIYYDFILAISNNSRFKNIKIRKYNTILTLIKALNKNQEKFNGLIKNKITLLIQKYKALQDNKETKEQEELLLKQIKQQISKIKQTSTSDLCYRQKLILLFTKDLDQKSVKIYDKYSSLLVSTNYTENRNLKIKELEFVRQLKDSKQRYVSNISTINTSSTIDTKNQSQVIVVEEKVKQNGTRTISERQAIIANGLGINLNVLNNKIKQIKYKKQHKAQEDEQKLAAQQSKQQQQKQNQKQTQQPTPQTQTHTPSPIQQKLAQKQPPKQKQQKQKQISRQKQKTSQINGKASIMQDKNKIQNFVPYYIKYLILF